MRLLYFILKVTLNYSLRIFYRRIKLVNSPKYFFGRTIFVSNHAASLMDPLIIGALQRPVIFFTARSDVFVNLLKPILWSAHMLPIYRKHDGQDTKGKNQAIFKQCSRILSFGRGLLIFGEGFTDDVFIRRLKPLKKGAVRIGFTTLEHIDWKKKIYISALGCNYSDPNQMRSDLLVSHSERICMNDYKEAYIENPNKTISELTLKIEQLLVEQITHVANKDLAAFHENIMTITRKGMNATNFDSSISLAARWQYSKGLANWINKQESIQKERLNEIRFQAENYFELLKKNNVEEKYVYWKKVNPRGKRMKSLFLLLLLFPVCIIGVIHSAIPYIFTKRICERSLKRKVFWGSAKLLLGMLSIGLLNLPFIYIFYHFIYPSWWLSIAYYTSIGITGFAAYNWMLILKEYQQRGRILKKDTSEIMSTRKELENAIDSFIPKKFV